MRGRHAISRDARNLVSYTSLLSAFAKKGQGRARPRSLCWSEEGLLDVLEAVLDLFSLNLLSAFVPLGRKQHKIRKQYESQSQGSPAAHHVCVEED